MAFVPWQVAADRVESKIRPLSELGALTRRLRKSGKKIVHCHGVFDLVHLGHIRHFTAAKKLGDVLVVTLTADKFVKRGPGRPIFSQNMRAEALSNLEIIDFVAIVDHPTAVEAIKEIRPNFYVKGNDYEKKETDVTGKIYDEEEAVASVKGTIHFTDDITFSSSHLLNTYFDTFPEPTVKYLKRLASAYSIDQIQDYLREARKLKVLVIGDAIIDQYHYSCPLGKSAKEAIVVNKYLGEEDFAGGTLATANHVSQVCDKVDLVTVLGRTWSFEEFIRERLHSTIKPKFFYRPEAGTTVKRRYVSEDAQKKLFEICFFDDSPLSHEEEAPLRAYLEKNLKKYDLVVVNDFGHGMITKTLMKVLCSKAKCLALNVQTNSLNHGFNLVTKYAKADIVCIDEQELRLATHDKHSDLTVLVKRIAKQLRAKHVTVTRGSHGSLSYTEDWGFVRTPSMATRSVDKVGAGDAFFSYVSPCFAVGMPQDLMGFIGNAVGALAIQIVGNREPVQGVELIKFMTRLLKV